MDYFKALIEAKVVQQISPKLLFFCLALGLCMYYYQGVGSSGPQWREVAVGCISLIGFLSAMGIRNFIKQVQSLQKDVVKLREANEAHHAANLAVMNRIILALKTGDTTDLDTV